MSESSLDNEVQNSEAQADAVDTPDALVELQTELKNLQNEHKRALTKIDENWNLFVRARAEMENVQRRARIDLDNARKHGLEKFAAELLAVVDSFDLGLEPAAQLKPEANLKALQDGMHLVYKLLLDALDKFEIKALNPINEDFDPAWHEALSMQVSKDVAPNKIIMVAQKGFTIAGRLLRPARVIVSRAEASTNIDEKA